MSKSKMVDDFGIEDELAEKIILEAKKELERSWVDEFVYMIDGEPIHVGETVYEKRRGWSGVPLEIVDFEDRTTYAVAIVKGANGWNVKGSISKKYGDARIRRISLRKLTREYNSMVSWSERDS